MTIRRDLCTALAPESLARDPHLPMAHRQVIRALPPCPSGPYGHSLSPGPHCGGQHRGHHACGNRHCPQCQPPTTPQGLQPHLETQLPGPPVLLPCTVPAILRPLLRSPPRRGSHAMVHAAAAALTRLAKDERVIGTDLPGCTGVLPTGGRHLQSHPPLHAIVPGGGLAAARTPWRPSRAHCFVPVKALSPISRALCKAAMRQAGRREDSEPQVWTLPWKVHRRAHHHGHSAFPSLAPSVCTVASANRRLVGLQDRTVTCTSRTVGRTRPRPAHLDGMALLRRFRQPGLPDGWQTVRHCGLLPARCAVPLATIRLMLGQGPASAALAPPRQPPPPPAARCPTWGAPRRVVMRLWTAHGALVETG